MIVVLDEANIHIWDAEYSTQRSLNSHFKYCMESNVDIFQLFKHFE